MIKEQLLVGKYWFSTISEVHGYKLRKDFIGEIVGTSIDRGYSAFGRNLVVKTSSKMRENWSSDFNDDSLRIISKRYLVEKISPLEEELL